MSFNPQYKATPDTLSEGQRTTGTVDATGALRVSGGGSSGETATGNPTRIAGTFNTTPPTYTTGEQSDIQTTDRGYVIVQLNGGSAAIVGAGNSAATIASTTTVNSIRAVNFNHVYNGTSWSQSSLPTTASRIPSAAATTNTTVAKATAGQLFKVHGYNASASVRYLKLYNKATAPTVGTDVPVLTFALQPTTMFNFDVSGFYFTTGIGYAMTTGAADNDTGALTLADVLGLNVVYA